MRPKMEDNHDTSLVVCTKGKAVLPIITWLLSTNASTLKHDSTEYSCCL